MAKMDQDPDGTRLPIKLDSTSNCEFEPLPLTQPNIDANAEAHRQADQRSRKLGLSRREFLVSACGAASSLLAMNAANAAHGRTGGYFALSESSSLDLDEAAATLGDREFIFDVQGHYVFPSTAQQRKAACRADHEDLSRGYMECLGADEFIQDVFMDADTDMMVLSFVPSARDSEPLTIQEAAATREIIAEMDGTHRLLLHGRVNPNQDGDLEGMDMLAEYGVSAWKTYTQWGPEGRGFWLTDDVGIAFIEKARALGVRNIAIHKGIPFGGYEYQYSLSSDIGPIARQFPDVNFLIYHSGWVPGQPEGPYDPTRGRGVDELIRSCEEAGVMAQGNVYPELGSTWRGMMQDPDSAAHLIGKLVKHFGEEQVLWGTDSVWYGSPQDQIQAFRSFQISEELQERHGYAAMSDALRAKVFGLNALRPYGISAEEAIRRAAGDRISEQRLAYREAPDPSFTTNGPRTRREFLELLSLNGGFL